MSIQCVHCIMPPAPELEEKINRSKQMFEIGQTLPAEMTVDVLDLRTLTLIRTRPAKTRPDTFGVAGRALAPVLGVKKALVCLVDFSDKSATQNQTHYQDMLFSKGSYSTGSMRDFYEEASYKKFDLQGKVFGSGGSTAGWFRAPKPKSYYTNGDYGFGAYPKNAQKLAEDVIDLANPFVNFSDYDNDGDGVVEAFVIIVAGSGGEVTGNKNDVWSHKWGITPKTVDGVKVQTYFMAPEDGRVGVMSHELGHLLMGWPDLYDTDYSSRGTGKWDLMAGGSWNNGGHTPANPTAWCKARVGWVNPVTIFNMAQSVTLQPYATHPHVYKLPIGSATSKEYFLASNRQKIGFDAHLPGEGMIIEHCDDNKSNNTDESHYLVDIEQCDGLRHLNKNQNSGDTDDPFPCGTNSEFTSTTTPNSKAYNGSDSKVSVKNIQRSGDTIKADLNVGGVAVKAWHHNKKVLQTFGGAGTQNVWANIETVGWRKVKPGAPDGVTNMFIGLCEAVGNSRLVSVQVDNQFIYIMYLR